MQTESLKNKGTRIQGVKGSSEECFVVPTFVLRHDYRDTCVGAELVSARTF